MLYIVLSIFSIALFVNIIIIYVQATNASLSDGSELKIDKDEIKENVFTGWIKNISELNNKVFVFPSTEAVLEFSDKKEKDKIE